MKLPLLSFLLFLLLPAYASFAQQNYTADQIPNPKANGDFYVSNPDGVLNTADEDSLNHVIARLEKKTKVEIAVVMVRQFEENEDDFNFALNLFKSWGIGKRKANNGLLLFVSTDRKKYRFITGYGLEGLLPDAALKRIGDHFLIPAFKEGNYSEGTVKALNTIAEYLSQPDNQKELEQLLGKEEKGINPWLTCLAYCAVIISLFVLIFRDIRKRTPKLAAKELRKIVGYDKVLTVGIVIMIFSIIAFFCLCIWLDLKLLSIFKAQTIPPILYVLLSFFLFFRYINALSVLRKSHTDDQNFITAVKPLNRHALLYLISSPLILIAIIIEEVRRSSWTKRFQPLLDSKNIEMTRVDRDKNKEGKPFLTKGQHQEEIQGAKIYDIWLSKDQTEHKIVENEGSNFNTFSDCTQCSFRTLGPPAVISLLAPSYTQPGNGKKVRTCTNCGYEEFIKMVVIPKLSDSKSSSDSSGSGSSSSSSDSSSWGGGSSGGGGAGGSW